MILRRYNDCDFGAAAKLLYETVHAVNAKDYNLEQLNAWAKSADVLSPRRADLLRQNTLIAEIGGVTVGFASMDNCGYLDFLYVHKDYQNQGVATALCDELEKPFSKITTYASVTAKSFFEKRGYCVVREQEAERYGVKLKNYFMLKIKEAE